MEALKSRPARRNSYQLTEDGMEKVFLSKWNNLSLKSKILFVIVISVDDDPLNQN